MSGAKPSIKCSVYKPELIPKIGQRKERVKVRTNINKDLFPFLIAAASVVRTLRHLPINKRALSCEPSERESQTTRELMTDGTAE